MLFKKTFNDGITVLKLKGKLMGGPETEQLHDYVQWLVANEVENIVIDFSGVRWINSSGLEVLMAAHIAVQNKGGTLKLASVTGKVESLLKITQLMDFFETYETAERAVSNFNLN